MATDTAHPANPLNAKYPEIITETETDQRSESTEELFAPMM